MQHSKLHGFLPSPDSLTNCEHVAALTFAWLLNIESFAIRTRRKEPTSMTNFEFRPSTLLDTLFTSSLQMAKSDDTAKIRQAQLLFTFPQFSHTIHIPKLTSCEDRLSGIATKDSIPQT